MPLFHYTIVSLYMYQCFIMPLCFSSVTSSGSFHTPFPSPSSNASSYSSMHRRWMRSMATSFEGIKKRNSQDNLAAQDAPVII